MRMQIVNNEMCCDLIIESVRYYSLYHFEINGFLRGYGKKRIMQEIRNAIKYNEIENEIMEILQYVMHHPFSDTSNSIQRLVQDYYEYSEKKVITFQIRIISKLIIINRMIKEGYI